MEQENLFIEQAATMLDDGFHCSQCVFSYLADRLGMDRAEALIISSGLGGGCFHGDSCGAVIGSLMAVGLVYGFSEPDEAQDQELIALTKKLQDSFIQKHGSVLCRDLLGGFDKADPNAVAPEGTYKNCAKYCADMCAIVEPYLERYYVK